MYFMYCRSWPWAQSIHAWQHLNCDRQVQGSQHSYCDRRRWPLELDQQPQREPRLQEGSDHLQLHGVKSDHGLFVAVAQMGVVCQVAEVILAYHNRNVVSLSLVDHN